MQRMQRRIKKTNKWINRKVSKRKLGNLNKFVLLLRKGVYPYECMDSWEKFDKTTLPPKEAFYSNLNLKDISNEDYAHAQKIWHVFEIKNLGEYHDLYV